jgi:hypothetical protein
VLLSARRRGIFVFKIPNRRPRLQQAFDVLYWWPTARWVSLDPPLQATSHAHHRWAGQRGPCIDALSMGLFQQLGAVRRESSAIWAFYLGQDRLGTNIGNGFVCLHMSATRKPLGSGFV